MLNRPDITLEAAAGPDLASSAWRADTARTPSRALDPSHPLERRSAFLLRLFRLYLQIMFWRRFHAVRVVPETLPPSYDGRPLIVYCNHPSWWDPALLLLALPRLLPGRLGFGPMDAAELDRYAVLQRMGLFGIEPGTARGAASFLRVARAGLTRPAACLVITAEGAFTDPRARPVRLRAGLAHLARRSPEAVVLPLAMEYTFWNESKPEALLRFGAPVRLAAKASVAEWQHALEDGLTTTMGKLASASMSRNSADFDKVFSGTAGVGGLYDAWRRVRATMTGQSFDARHEPKRR